MHRDRKWMVTAERLRQWPIAYEHAQIVDFYTYTKEQSGFPPPVWCVCTHTGRACTHVRMSACGEQRMTLGFLQALPTFPFPFEETSLLGLELSILARSTG